MGTAAWSDGIAATGFVLKLVFRPGAARLYRVTLKWTRRGRSPNSSDAIQGGAVGKAKNPVMPTPMSQANDVLNGSKYR